MAEISKGCSDGDACPNEACQHCLASWHFVHDGKRFCDVCDCVVEIGPATSYNEPLPSSEKDDVLIFWTIYDKPLDYPIGYIARPFEVGAREPKPLGNPLTGTLEEIRHELRDVRGLYLFPRSNADHPTVVETWM